MRVCFRLPEILFLHLLVQDDTDFISSLSLLSFFYLSSFPLLSLFSLSLISLLSLALSLLSLLSLSYLSLISLISLSLSLSLSLTHSPTLDVGPYTKLFDLLPRRDVCAALRKRHFRIPRCPFSNSSLSVVVLDIAHFRIPRCLLLFWILYLF